MPLSTFALNCTLKASPAQSSCDVMLTRILECLAREGAPGEVLRLADFEVKPGVTSDEGDGDDWPQLRRKILDADIFLLGTPIWLGHPSSMCQRTLERLDAFLGETDDAGRMPSYGKVAAVAVVGNEDGAHHVSSQLFQGLNDVGFTLPASGVAYWVGEAMQKTNFMDLPETPETVRQSMEMLASNAVHLAGLLKSASYPGM